MHDCSIRIKLLTIDDSKSDIKQKNSGGVILLTKIVGAMAEMGRTFDDICQFYMHNIANHILTVPISFQLNYDKSQKRPKLNDNFNFELGRTLDRNSFLDLKLHPGMPLVILINTPKQTSRLLEHTITLQIIERLKQTGQAISRVFLGNFFSTETINVTAMKVSDERVLDYLDNPGFATGL